MTQLLEVCQSSHVDLLERQWFVLQIHYLENGSVEIYSRNAERNTVKFPDIVAAIGRQGYLQRLGCPVTYC